MTILSTYIPHAYIPRENEGGNYCGHFPEKPRFLLPDDPHQTGDSVDALGNKRRSKILYKMVARIQEYYHDVSIIPTLNGVNGSSKKQRSERREACIDLLEAMVMNMDLSSLRVGYPSKDGFQNYSLDWLAKKANLSFSRAKRALANIKQAGIMAVVQAGEQKDDGTYRGFNAVKFFNHAFFQLLGFRAWLEKERKKSSKKAKREAESENITQREMANYNMLLAGLGGGSSGRKKRKKEGAEFTNQRLNRLIGEVAAEHPNLSGDRIRELAKQLL